MMSVRINHNITAMNTYGALSFNQAAASQSIDKLSSGLRINKAADDAAGLGISEGMRAQIRGLQQASRNAQDAVSMVQTAEGGLATIQQTLQRMRELAVQSANGTYTATDRSNIETEFLQLQAEIDQIATSTQFNNQNLINGSLAAGVTFQIGANNGANFQLVVSIANAATSALGVSTDVQVYSQSGAMNAISSVNAAINTISQQRANIGAVQNRLEYAIENLSVSDVNTTAAESRIRDV
ncbi:MAG: flagellin, partial [Negativicutes bacterium]|nr:flagellin [Negativicutes bacterium]